LVAHDEGWDQADFRELFDQAVAFETESKLLPQSLLWTGKSGMRKALSTILVIGPMLTRRAGDVAGEGFAKKERLSGEREMFLKADSALDCSESLSPTGRPVGIQRTYALLPRMTSINW
jgi:hypothetical protein